MILIQIRAVAISTAMAVVVSEAMWAVLVASKPVVDTTVVMMTFMMAVMLVVMFVVRSGTAYLFRTVGMTNTVSNQRFCKSLF